MTREVARSHRDHEYQGERAASVETKAGGSESVMVSTAATTKP
jgi:hypothetical protein